MLSKRIKMKFQYFIVTVISLLAMAILSGFYINQDGKAKVLQDDGKHSQEGLKNAETGFDKEWPLFKSDAELNINDKEAGIADFKVKIKTTGKDSKAKYEKEVTVLEQNISGLKKKINEYKFEGNDKWEEFKLEFSHKMEVIERALE